MYIAKYIIEYMIIYYIALWKFMYPFIIFIFWYWLIYVDGIHLRLKYNNDGKNIVIFIKKHLENKYMVLLSKYIFAPLNSFGEIICGFTDGLLNKEPSLNISYVINKEIQCDNYDNFEKDTILFDKNIQTLEYGKIKMFDKITNTDFKKNDVGTNTNYNNNIENDTEYELNEARKIFVIKNERENIIDYTDFGDDNIKSSKKTYIRKKNK